MIQLQSIGTVHNAISTAHRDTRWQDIESKIEIDAQWRDALDSLDGFSHIWVVTYLDRMPAPEALRIHPKPADESVWVGIFATRAPQRPNPIGICAAELLQVRDTVLRVRGLDVLDGTPVLDLGCTSRAATRSKTRASPRGQKTSERSSRPCHRVG